MFKKTLKIFAAVFLGLGFSLIFCILLLRWVNPPFSSFTLQENWDEMAQESYNLRTYWVPSEDIPEHMIWAVVAAEDQLFFEHFGFDIESIEDAWEERQEGERVRGASTISMQVSKNLFLTSDQNFLRKGVEAGITVLIELFWPKERIVEVYLNIAQFGPGIYGIGKASEHYFNRPASQLTPLMAARFAAVLPSPSRMRINPPSPYTRERSRWILQQMNQLTGKTYFASGNNSGEDAETEEPGMNDSSATAQNEPDTTAYNSQADSLYKAIPDSAASLTNTADTTSSL